MDIFTAPGDPNGVTWGIYERQMQALGRSPRTIQNYGEACEQLAEHCGGADLLELARGDIESYLIKMRIQHSPATQLVRYRSLHAFYGWAAREELIEVSPMARMTLPRSPDKPPPVPSSADISALLMACNGPRLNDLRDKAIILLMADAGLRLAECAGLATESLMLRAMLVNVRGKGGRWRLVPCEERTAVALRKYLSALHKRPGAVLWLWRGSSGPLTASGITHMLRRRCDQAGIARIRPHQLRHWSAHEAFRAGISDQDAMRLYGWSTPDMARVYGRALSAERAIEHRRAISIMRKI